MTSWLAASLAALALVWAMPGRPRPRRVDQRAPRVDEQDWMRRWRWCWCLLAGSAAASFVSGTVGLVAGVCVAGATWWWIGRAEPASERRRRESVERDLPALVHLLAAALDSGSPVSDSVSLVCRAYPGAGADVLVKVHQRLSLGVEPGAAWRVLVDDPRLAPLGRAMIRAERSGASVTDEVARLADELSRRARASVEERARAVGVKAAVPLGLCLLPSFVLIGIVPLVVSLLQSLSL
jgi:Flp pilus assembly protein TadB